MKEVDTVLVGPVKSNPAFFNSVNPTYCCHINAIPRMKVSSKNRMEAVLRSLLSSFIEMYMERLLNKMMMVLV